MVKIVSKTELMQPVINGSAHEAFTHSELGTFDITAMRTAAQRGDYGELYQAELNVEMVVFLRSSRDWEPQRVWNLLIDPEAPWDADPAMTILCPDGTHLLCDGTHRLLARWSLRCTHFLFWMVPFDQAIRPVPGYVKPLDWGKELKDGVLQARE